jgi:hypothetical protein
LSAGKVTLSSWAYATGSRAPIHQLGESSSFQISSSVTPRRAPSERSKKGPVVAGIGGLSVFIAEPVSQPEVSPKSMITFVAGGNGLNTRS